MIKSENVASEYGVSRGGLDVGFCKMGIDVARRTTVPDDSKEEFKGFKRRGCPDGRKRGVGSVPHQHFGFRKRGTSLP